MGNLLGSPITEKETHVGVTRVDDDDNDDDEDQRLRYGLSSMQGWRVHMEDAHIAEGDLYALDVVENGDSSTSNDSSSNVTSSDSGSSNKIRLKGHSLFAVYDGHGGTFSAIYSGNNFLRVLSKQKHFVRYAKLCRQEEEEEEKNKKKDGGNQKQPQPTATATEKNIEAKKLSLLEKAFQQAFVETDYEIALALRGQPHPDANTPYHHTTTNSTSATNTTTLTTDEGGEKENHGQQYDGADDSGTTACVVMITPTTIFCANAGDSRAIFARRISSDNSGEQQQQRTFYETNRAIPLSFDHKPDDEMESNRIRAAGGYVAGGRVEGDLAVSRGLGDFRFKQMAIVLNNTNLFPENQSKKSSGDNDGGIEVSTDHVGSSKDDDDDDDMDVDPVVLFQPGEQKVSPIPDIVAHTRQPDNDEYVVVACDGIWDVVSNQQLVHEVDAIMYKEGERDVGLIAEEILDTCLRYGSKDNMTAIVIQLPACRKSYDRGTSIASSEKSSQSGVAGRRRKRDVMEGKGGSGGPASDEDDDTDTDDDDDDVAGGNRINTRDTIVDAAAVKDAAASVAASSVGKGSHDNDL